MKIRTAIYGTYVVASAVGLAVLMRFVLAEVRPRQVASLQRTMQESADLLAATLATKTVETWDDVYARIGENRGGLRLRVVNAAGEVAFDSQPEMAAEAERAFAMKRFRSAKTDISLMIDRRPFYEEGELEAEAAVERGGEMVGRVRLSRPLSTVNALIWSERKKLTAGALAVSAVMLGLGWWLSSKLTHSLERLTGYAQAVRDGREARPPSSRALEIAQLGEAFEGMRRTLEGKAHVEHYTQSLAHELKAPLSAIRGAAELLQEDLPAEERGRFLANLRNESQRIQQIVDRMLRLAALEARAGLQDTESVGLAEVVDEAFAALAMEAKAAGVALRAGAELADARVEGERFLLLQAVINLVQNAIEFSPVGAVVRVSGSRVEGAVMLAVEDDGPGLPAYAEARVFERFYSLPRPRSGRKSTGLGLSFVREIVTRHGGTVGVENRAAGGARAWMRLPGAADFMASSS